MPSKNKCQYCNNEVNESCDYCSECLETMKRWYNETELQLQEYDFEQEKHKVSQRRLNNEKKRKNYWN